MPPMWAMQLLKACGELAEYIGEEGQLIGAVAFGIADEEPEARPRKKLEDIVEYHV